MVASRSRIATLDRLLTQLEELRLGGTTRVPERVRQRILACAAREDTLLREALCERPDDVEAVHDALFEAQGRAMLELAERRRAPSWQELEDLLAEEAA